MSTRTDGPDPVRSKLRATMALLEREIGQLPKDSAVQAPFADLVGQLQLGPEPELRECPHCHHHGMRLATRCMHCWNALVPPA